MPVGPIMPVGTIFRFLHGAHYTQIQGNCCVVAHYSNSFWSKRVYRVPVSPIGCESALGLRRPVS
jgi:hypothetical protein